MNFSEINPVDVFNWLMGVGMPIPGGAVIFFIMIVVALLGGMRCRSNVERANAERVKEERERAERLAEQQSTSEPSDPGYFDEEYDTRRDR
jgi:hypothetical protein